MTKEKKKKSRLLIHGNPLKATTVLISGPRGFKYCMCCIYWTKNIKTHRVRASSKFKEREVGPLLRKNIFR